MHVTAVVPSLNPDEKFLHVVEGLVQAGFEHIILVNDGSNPENLVWFEKATQYPQCTLLTHEVNKGKGRALKTAMAHFLQAQNGDMGVVTLDGDGQHAIDDVVRCAEELEAHPECLILGVRDFGGKDVPARSSTGNRITSFVFRHLCGIPVSDTQTGLRGISADFARRLLDVKGERFEFETNMLLDTKAAGVTIREVKISTVYLEENKSSHFRVFRDSFSIYALILKYLSSSLTCTLIDYVLFVLLCWLLRDQWHDGIYLLVATAGARLVSSLCNYTINRKVVFHSHDKVVRTLVRYYTVSIGQMLSSYGGVFLLKHFLSVPDWVAKLPVDIILFFICFRIQRNWVFRK